MKHENIEKPKTSDEKASDGVAFREKRKTALRRLILAILCIVVNGCVNLYTRCPFTDSMIQETYQCTYEAAGLSYVIMFPQVMQTTGGNGFMPENLVTVPIGLLGFADVAAEACLDTVFYPADAYMSRTRKAIRHASENR